MTTDFELGYCMGLIVGEGSFTGSDYPCLTVRMKDDPTPLAVLSQRLGGRIYGPYPSSNGASTWMLFGLALRDTLPVLDTNLPDSKKRDQYLTWRLRWHDYFSRSDSRWRRPV